MKINKQETRSVKKTITLDRDDILEFLRDKYVFPDEELNSLNIYIRVPGGGDWSNTNLDIDNLNPIVIEFEYSEEVN